MKKVHYLDNHTNYYIIFVQVSFIHMQIHHRELFWHLQRTLKLELSYLRCLSVHYSSSKSVHVYIASVDSPYPNVYLRAKVFFPLEHLWGSIRRTTTKCTQGLVCLEEIPEAKVGNFNVHVGIQEQVLSLKSKSR